MAKSKTKPYKHNPFRRIAAAGNDNAPGGGRGGVRTPYIGPNEGLTGGKGARVTTPGVSGGYTGDAYILTEPFPDNDNKRRR